MLKPNPNYEQALFGKTLRLVVTETTPEERATIKGYAVAKALQNKKYKYNKQLQRFA